MNKYQIEKNKARASFKTTYSVVWHEGSERKSLCFRSIKTAERYIAKQTN